MKLTQKFFVLSALLATLPAAANVNKCMQEAKARKQTAEQAANAEYNASPVLGKLKHFEDLNSKLSQRHKEAHEAYRKAFDEAKKATPECAKAGSGAKQKACQDEKQKPVTAALDEVNKRKKLWDDVSKNYAQAMSEERAVRKKRDDAIAAARRKETEEIKKCR